MRKCDKIVFDQIKDNESRHAVYKSFLAEEIKMKHKISSKKD